MRHPIAVRSTEDRLILQKAAKAKLALEEFVQRETQLRRQANQVMARAFGQDPLPSRLSWKVWLLRNGLVAIRYQDWRPHERIEFVIDDAELADWTTTIPTPKGDVQAANIHFATAGVFSAGRIMFSNLKAEVKNVTIMSSSYEDDRFREPEQLALVDMRLTAVGRLLQITPATIQAAPAGSSSTDSGQKAIQAFDSLLAEFEGLLGTANREEEVQSFLKSHPELFGAVQVIPKQKLADDFVTDFVLLNPLPQGPEYTLVEIESPSKNLFTKAGVQHSDLTQAKDQILNWRVWLNSNQAYLQKKLEHFATPRFLIVIGRDQDLTCENREKLRSMNGASTDETIRTYDDLLSMGKALLAVFRRFVDGTPKA